MFAALAARLAVRRRGLVFGSPPPMRAAMLISRMIRVNTRPRFASVAPFLCLIVAHFECPDMTHPRLFHVTRAWPWSSMEEFLCRRAVSESAGRLAGTALRRPCHCRTSSEPRYGRQAKRHQCGDL